MLKINKKINMLLKNKLVIFFLITFFAFNLTVLAADFNYADFDFDTFAEENKTYWTTACINQINSKDQEQCVEEILSNQKQYYTRLYKLLAKYQKKGYFIDDNIIIMTTFYDLTPDLFGDDGVYYKEVMGEGRPYNYDPDLDLDYDIDEEVDFDYFANEVDTLDLLIRNMLGYESKCYGIHSDVVEVTEDDETYFTCPDGGSPTQINNKNKCVSIADFKIVGFWEYMAERSGVNWFFGVKNKPKKHCESISVQYAEGTHYEMLKGKRYSPETLKKYWEFLETSNYFDKKPHLESYFQVILEKTEIKNMNEFHKPENIDIAEEYSEQLLEARKKIVDTIKSILASRGSRVDTVNLYGVNNSQYWWPIGSSEITTDGDGKEYAMGDPIPTRLSSPHGERPDPMSGERKFHYGIDLAGGGDAGTVPIIAARSGIVEKVVDSCVSYGDNTCGGYLGNHVTISHGDGNFTLYGHMHENSITVKKGDSVNQGQVIGKMGSSGKSTGSHLHFEIRVGSNNSSSSMNPTDYVSMDTPRQTMFNPTLVEGDTNQQTVCKTLLANGYSINGTIGLMVNAKAESSFNPTVVGDSGTSYGLFQWHKSRKNNLMHMFAGSYSNIDSQISFLTYELENSYNQLYNNLKTNSSSGEDLAYKFCVEFERPAGGSTTCKNRASKHIAEMQSYVNNSCE